VIRGERNQETAAHAVADRGGARRVGAHALDEVMPRLVHLAEELAVGVFRLQLGALADVRRPRDAEHVEEARYEHIEPELGETIGVDLVVGRDAMSVVHHQDPGSLAEPLGMRHVAGNPVLLERDHARDDRHFASPLRSARSLIETRQWTRSSSGG
jgi:hypothetical protein